MGSGYRRQEEYIIVASKGHPKAFNLKNIGSVIQCKKVSHKSRLHPHEKPLELIDIFIKNSTKEGDTVMDCFMGSGVTGESCIKNNLNFYGYDLDSNTFSIAVKRITEAGGRGIEVLE